MGKKNERPVLHIIAIHGTFAGKANLRHGATDENEFYAETSEFAKTLIQKLSKHYDVFWHDYQWSGENLQSEREQAAKLRPFREREGISLDANKLIIAHSHGGNVAFEWLTLLKKPNPTGLVSVGTPYVHLKERRGLARLAYYLRNIITIFAFPGFFILSTSLGSSRIFVTWILIFTLACIGAWVNSKKERQRRKNRQFMQNKNIVAICHPDDEAVAILQSETKIPVSAEMVFQPLRSLGFPIIVVVCVGLFLSAILGGYRPFMPMIKNPLVSEFINYVLIFSVSAIVSAMGVFAILGSTIFIAKKLFTKGIGKRASNALSTALMKVGKGEDNEYPIHMKKEPQCPGDNFTIIDETNNAISEAFERTHALASENIIKHKSAFMSELLKHGGDLFSVLKNHPELAQSLVHCNYFTKELAEFIGSHVPEWFGDEYAATIDETS